MLGESLCSEREESIRRLIWFVDKYDDSVFPGVRYI